MNRFRGDYLHGPHSHPELAGGTESPTHSDLNRVAEEFLRAHWDELKGYYEAIAVPNQTINGSAAFDEFGLVMKVRELAALNGSGVLSAIMPEDLKKRLRVGFRKVANGVTVGQLVAQRKRLMIEEQTSDQTAE